MTKAPDDRNEDVRRFATEVLKNLPNWLQAEGPIPLKEDLIRELINRHYGDTA
jgi:hypothetical protein